MRRTLLTVSIVMLAVSRALAAAPVDVGSDADRAAGKKLYDVNCSQCHGEKGDGQGIAAPFLLPKPRDFTAGKFKIRTTPSGALPTTQDLKSIIRAGMPYTAMPAWPQFTDPQLTQLVYYVKSFDQDFAKAERQTDPIKIPSAPSSGKDSIEKGQKLYADLGCARCHGDLGRTDGISAPTLKDDWGNAIRPADLTRRWTFRGGPTRTDIFRAFSTGLNGTPMPSFVDSLSEDQRWDLANYVYSLSPSDSPNYSTVVVAKKIQKELDLAEGVKLFEDAEPAFFPVVGQIMQPVREFHPPCNGIGVRAVYNESDIAFELTWNDMRAEANGKNAPDIAVPAEEDQGEKPAAKAAEGGGSVWGEEAEAEPTAKPAAQKSDEGGFWGDETGGAPAGPASEFSDAVAIQFPVEIPTTIRKPYFIFGDKGNAVDLWFADLAKKQARLYRGHGSDGLELQGSRDLASSSHYDKGQWTVVFKRRLRSQGEISFEEGAFVPIALSVWDGGSRERGNKRAVTNWWTVYLSPGEKQSPAGQMVKWAGFTLVLEIVFIGWARRRKNGAGVES